MNTSQASFATSIPCRVCSIVVNPGMPTDSIERWVNGSLRFDADKVLLTFWQKKVPGFGLSENNTEVCELTQLSERECRLKYFDVLQDVLKYGLCGLGTLAALALVIGWSYPALDVTGMAVVTALSALVGFACGGIWGFWKSLHHPHGLRCSFNGLFEDLVVSSRSKLSLTRQLEARGFKVTQPKRRFF